MPLPTRYPGHYTPRQPWAPMTDAEWAALSPYVTRDRARGGRPSDDRRTWDAIFHVACSRDPWRCLPDVLGNPNSAHRALMRATRAGILDHLLVALSPHPLAQRGALASLAYRILRAWRRASRRVSMAALFLAKRLGLWTALPCAPVQLPWEGLSELICGEAQKLRIAGGLTRDRLQFLIGLHRLNRPNLRGWSIR